MDKYFNSYREMISLRGLTDHTIKSYSIYIKAYFEYLTDVIHKSPKDVSWDEMRQFILWIQDTRSLSDRSINAVISQLRFFTMYVLHKPWDETQLPMHKFDTYLPYVPTADEVNLFIDTLPTLKLKVMVASVRRLKSFATPLPPSIPLLIPTCGSLHLAVNTRDWTFTSKINAMLGTQRKRHMDDCSICLFTIILILNFN